MTLRQAQTAIANREGFVSGNLQGLWKDSRTYAVYSYGTQIAVYRRSDVFIGVASIYLEPNAYNHSQTTSKHANIVKRAWGVN